VCWPASPRDRGFCLVRFPNSANSVHSRDGSLFHRTDLRGTCLCRERRDRLTAGLQHAASLSTGRREGPVSHVGRASASTSGAPQVLIDQGLTPPRTLACCPDNEAPVLARRDSGTNSKPRVRTFEDSEPAPGMELTMRATPLRRLDRLLVGSG
jgi:hypothetical protein